MKDLCLETFQYIECTEPQHFHLFIQSVSKLFVGTIDKISRIVVERDINNAAAGPLPPVLPHEIVKLSGQQFSHIIREQKLRKKNCAQRREPQFKKYLDDCDHKTSFEKGWFFAGKRCPLLQEFAGVIATVFPGTSTVESDFSEIT
ncbi:hypothetical protein PsorP6_000481 [Peronosclerospora sorghi]|uniref:Uncharacterized protein n=1 Tax=Peronosclerospora sorghi TaxID=230839 RepID=A0ACC0WU55_9STRA|nr:hypothetical protein PsorP6_000481 [Peronosclerospora sorghi]